MRWYFVTSEGDSNTTGPYKEQEFARKFQTGEINENTFVWNGKTVTDWMQIKNVDGLAEKLRNYNFRDKSSSRNGNKRSRGKIPKYQVGDTLYVLEAGGNLERSVVCKLKDETMKIHYVGYPSKYDEWIPFDSERIKSNRRRTSTSSTRSRNKKKNHDRLHSTPNLNRHAEQRSRSKIQTDEDTFSDSISSRKKNTTTLRREKELFEAEKDSLIKLKTEFFGRSFDLSKYVKSSEDINHELILELETQRTLVINLQNEREDLEQKLVQNKERIGELESNNSDMEQQVGHINEERAGIEKERQQVRRKLKDLKQVAVDRQVLRQLKREIKANREKLEQQNNSIAMQEGDSSQRMAELQNKLTEIQAERDHLETEKNELLLEKENLEKNRDQFTTERRTLMKAHEVFSREKEEFQEERKLLKEENERLKRNEIELKKELESKHLQLMEEKAQIQLEKERIQNVVKEQISNMKNEFVTARQKQLQDEKELEEQKKSYEERISLLEHKNGSLQAENEVLDQQRAKLMEQAQQNFSLKNEEAGNKLNRISEQMLQLTGSCTELQIQNSSLTQELALTKGDMLAKTREVERLTKQLEDKSQKMEVTNESLSEIKAEKANLVLQRKMWDQNKDHLEQEIQRLQEQIERKKKEKEEIREHNIRLEHQVEQLDITVNELNDQLDEKMPPPPAFNTTNSSVEVDKVSAEARNLPHSVSEFSVLAAPTNLENNFHMLMEKILEDRQRMQEEEREFQQSEILMENSGNDVDESPTQLTN